MCSLTVDRSLTFGKCDPVLLGTDTETENCGKSHFTLNKLLAVGLVAYRGVCSNNIGATKWRK